MYLKSKIAQIALLVALIILSICIWIEYPITCSILSLSCISFMSMGYINENLFNNDKRN